MMKKILQSLEDPERPILAPNYWSLKFMGMLLPESKISKLVYIIIHEIVAFFVFTQYLELYLIRSDLDQVISNLRISMLSTICIVKVNTFVLWQEKWKQVLEYVTEIDKEERASRDLTKGKILDNYTKYCRRVTYFYWILTAITAGTVITTPLIKYSSSDIYREKLRNGTEIFPHIFSSWMPFDKYHPPGSWVTVVWHAVLCGYGAAVMGAYDATVVVIMVVFCGKLEILRERCKQMLGVDGKGISEMNANRMLNQLHEVHILFLSCLVLGGYRLAVLDLQWCVRRHSALFNSLLSPAMFVYMVMCSVALCTSAFQLTLATNTTQKIVMAEYLVFGIAQLFVFCWHSNQVLTKNQELFLGLYESQWWAVGARVRKNLVIFSGQLRVNHAYTAGPFIDLTLSTFISILKGAYSYYTLLDK